MGQYENGKLIDVPVKSLPKGGYDVTQQLLLCVRRAMGDGIIDEFKQMYPTIWSCVETRIDDVKRVGDVNPQLEIGYLGEWLLEQGFNQEHSFTLQKTDHGVFIKIPLKAIKEAYDVIMDSKFMRDVKLYIESATYDYVFLVGGLSNSRIVKNRIKDSFKAKVIMPSSPESYAMVGASSFAAMKQNIN